jgi:GNAT superfamily N-acetyltransferase
VVEIRPAEQRDAEAFAVLMEDLDRYYGATDTELPGQRVRQIAENLFESMTRSLYLKELYVTKEFRCKGIGALLMQQLCQVAVEHECSRVEWTSDQNNTLAEAFYGRLGGPKNPEKNLLPTGR